MVLLGKDVYRYREIYQTMSQLLAGKNTASVTEGPSCGFHCCLKTVGRCPNRFLGPIFPRANDHSSVILVVTDCFTRYAEAYPLPHQKASLVAQTLVGQVFCRYGVPQKIHSDQGRNFTSELISEIMKLYQVRHVKGSAYRPQSQSNVERKI